MTTEELKAGDWMVVYAHLGSPVPTGCNEMGYVIDRVEPHPGKPALDKLYFVYEAWWQSPAVRQVGYAYRCQVLPMDTPDWAEHANQLLEELPWGETPS